MTATGARSAFITGGSRGIGRAVALNLAARGFSVLGIGFVDNVQAAERTMAALEETGAKCHLARANLASPTEIIEMFDSLPDSFSELDTFVHCAAIGAFKPTLTVKPNQWDLSLSVNARSFLTCVQQVRARMKQSSSIVAISSLGSRRVIPNYGAVGPSKAALESLVRQLAVELAPEGIRVNGVAGGYIESEAVGLFPNADLVREEVLRRTPAGRLGQPADIAEVIGFLVSPEARWIYGQIIDVDGGLSLI